MKQYVRLYVDIAGKIEHVETSDRSLRESPSIVVIEPTVPIPPNATQDEILLLPTREKIFDLVQFTMEHPAERKLIRAKDILNDLDVDHATKLPTNKRGKMASTILTDIVVNVGRRGP